MIERWRLAYNTKRTNSTLGSRLFADVACSPMVARQILRPPAGM